ncbi:MAG: ABC transporter permease subunit [Clostridia bacterium]|nr:ABC transporter permease subunit [Clostridia bacterium]MBN2882460.1 ABC transporter permease subunit [Clostridia bacterium]
MRILKNNLVPITISIIIMTALVYMAARNNQNYFNENLFSSFRAIDQIEELCSRDYSGRLAGSEGNNLALNYIADYFAKNNILPAGDDGTYFQGFSTMMPEIEKGSEFVILDSDGQIIDEYEIFMDYNALTDMNGGSIDFTGELLLVGDNLLRINKEYIKGRIIVVSSVFLQSDKVQYVMENGGAGILCAGDVKAYVRARHFEQEKGLNASGKTGNSILVGYISNDIFRALEENMVPFDGQEKIIPDGLVPNVRIKVEMKYPIIDTANVMGKIEGKEDNGRYLLITANIDSVGEGEGIRYFPGAVSNTSGLATMMEIAKAAARQESQPYETIIFIGWNAQQRQNSGSEYYLENPLYPFDKTTIIHLEDIGVHSLDGLKVASDSIVSQILKDKIVNYAEDAGLVVSKTGPLYSPARRFTDYKVAGVMLSDEVFTQNTYNDAPYIVHQNSLENAGMVVMNYLKREVYKDVGIDYINVPFLVILILLVAVLLLNIIAGRLYKFSPYSKLFKGTVEDFYFSKPVMIIRRGIKLVLPILIALFLLVFIANIDPELNISKVNNEMVSNFSGYLALKKTLLYFQNIFSSSSTTEGGANIAGTIAAAALRSLVLMLSALAVSIVAGIARGLKEGYRSKRKNSKSLGTLVVFSIPDVLIVLVGMLLYIYIAQNMRSPGDISILRKFILPFITLSILPSIYISRITYIAVQDEIRLEYIMNAKAKGLSRRRIFTSELLPAVSFRIIDSLPAIMTMLFSNMIIVEYLFNYLGLMNYLIYFYNRHDINGFIMTAVTMGAIYVLLTWGIQFLAGFINPLKRRHGK